MLILLNLALILSLAIITVKFLSSTNSYEKITAFYFIFSNFIILVLINAITEINTILDITIILFLLQFITILFLLKPFFVKKK